MIRAGATLVLALAALPAAAQDTPPRREVPVFGAGTEMVHLDVFVSRDAAAVGDLTASDFEVRDNGVVQSVELVDRSAVPASVLLVFDTSQSVAGAKLQALQTAARSLVSALGPDDRAGFIAFSHRASLRAEPERDKGAVVAAIDMLQAEGGTALRDAVFAALCAPRPEATRPMVVVFSDGDDRSSWISDEELRNAARLSEAVVYSVYTQPVAPADLPERTAPRPGSQSRNPFARQSLYSEDQRAPRASHLVRTAPSLLQLLAEQTGGRAWGIEAAGEIAGAFASIAGEARSRYLLRYEPRGVARYGLHEVAVSLQGRSGEVRSRRSYFVPSPSTETPESTGH